MPFNDTVEEIEIEEISLFKNCYMLDKSYDLPNVTKVPNDTND